MAGSPDWQAAWLVASSATVFALGAFAGCGLHHRRRSGAVAFAVLCAIAACWSIAVLMTALSAPGPDAEAWLRIRYALATLSPPSVTWFLLEAGGWMPRRRRAATVAAFSAPSLAVVAAMAVEPSGAGWILRSVEFARTGSITHVAALASGSLRWFALGWGYALTLANLGLAVAWSRRAGPLARGQGVAIAIGILAPTLANASKHLQLGPPWFDPMPIGLAVSVAAIAWSLLRHRLLDLVPVAKQRVLDAMVDGVLATDATGRVIDLNPAMAAILRVDPRDAIGRPAGALLATAGDLAAHLRAAAARIAPDGAFATIGLRHYGVRVVPLATGTGSPDGRLLLLHDLTARIGMERERERLIDALRSALGQVRTLRGLVPLCASCKNVRDAEGRWRPVDAYIRDHSAATVSHGICPDCTTRLYPAAYRDAASGR